MAGGPADKTGRRTVGPQDRHEHPVRKCRHKVEMQFDGIAVDFGKPHRAFGAHRPAETNEIVEIVPGRRPNIHAAHRVLVFMTGATASRVNGTGSSPFTTTRASVA